MGNCLVTKLKGVVDNDNLPKLGQKILTVEPNAGGEYQRGIQAAGTGVAFTLSDDFSVTPKYFDNNVDVLIPANEGGTLTIDNYYALGSFRGPHVIIDANMLKYTPNLTSLSLGYCSPESLIVFSEVKEALKNVTVLEIHDITADFADFATLTGLTSLIIGKGERNVAYQPRLSNFEGILNHPNINNMTLIKIDGLYGLPIFQNLSVKRSTIVSMLTGRGALHFRFDIMGIVADITDEEWNTFLALTPGTQRGYLNEA